MKNGNLEFIIESIISENESGDMFRTNIDPINVYVAGLEKWGKYRSAFGDSQSEDSETHDFIVLWDADFEYKRDGIYGISVDILDIKGTIEIKAYNESTGSDEVKGSLGFNKEDFEKMTLVNEPKMSEHHQLLINGIDIDFNRNTVTIEYY